MACRRRGRTLAVSVWLGAGALGVGLGSAVLAGAGAAHADDGTTPHITNGPADRDAPGHRAPRPAAANHPTVTVAAPQVFSRAPKPLLQRPRPAASATTPIVAPPERM